MWVFLWRLMNITGYFQQMFWICKIVWYNIIYKDIYLRGENGKKKFNRGTVNGGIIRIVVAVIAIIIAIIVLTTALKSWDPENIGGGVFMCIIAAIMVIASVSFVFSGIKMCIDGKNLLKCQEKDIPKVEEFLIWLKPKWLKQTMVVFRTTPFIIWNLNILMILGNCAKAKNRWVEKFLLNWKKELLFQFLYTKSVLSLIEKI